MNEMLHMNLYRGYRTRSFSEIFDSLEKFVDFYETCGIPHKIDNSIETLYYLLLAKYANDHIASEDENRFSFECMAIIFQYGPAWQAKLKLQEDITELVASGNDSLYIGTTQINNVSLNPQDDPTTQTVDELPTINNQNVFKTKRGKLEVYNYVNSVLEDDITESFLNRFKKLFTIFAPEQPILYVNELESETED